MQPDPATQTPDLQTATGITPPPQMTGPSILSALGSIQGPSPGLAAGSAMLNSLGGGPPGGNPYLQQHAQAQRGMIMQVDQARMMQAQQQQQMMMMEQMKQRANEMKLKRHQAELSVAQTLIKINTPQARSVGGRMLESTLETMGQPGAAGLAKDIADSGGLSHQEMEDAFKAVIRGFDDNAMYEQFKNLKAPVLAAIRLNADKDDTRKSLGFLTLDEAKKLKLENQAKESEGIIKRWGNLPSEVLAAVDHYHIKKYGKTLVNGTDDSLNDAFLNGYGAWKADRDAKDARAEQHLAISREAENRRERALQLQTQQNSALLAQLTGGGGGLGGDVPGYKKKTTVGSDGKVRITYEEDTKTKENLAGLEQTDLILADMDEMSKRIITAKTWSEAFFVQGPKLSGGAVTGMIGDAKVYADKKDGMLSVISKTIGKETGVLTDRDIIRVSNMLPGFTDTERTREMKMEFLKSLTETTKEVQLAIWNKTFNPNMASTARTKALKIISDSEKRLGLPRSVRAIGPNGKPGTMRLNPGESLPPGFKEVAE